MDLLAGLQAASNFGTGFVGGQQMNQQNTYTQQMQKLALQNQETTNQNNQQILNDNKTNAEAMASQFSPSIMSPTGGKIGTKGITPPQAPPQPQANPSDMAAKFQQVANLDFAKGDVNGGNAALKQSETLQMLATRQQSAAASSQLVALKTRAVAHSLVAQVMGNPAITTPEQFEAAKEQVLNDPRVPPNEKANIAKMQFSPQLVRNIRMAGMTSAQQAQQQARKVQEQQIAQHDADMENLQQQRINAMQAATKARAESAAKKAKEGGTVKVPSPNDITVAQGILTSQGLPADAAGTIAYDAMQIMASNRAISYEQAINMAIADAKKTGQFTTTAPTPPQGIERLNPWAKDTPGKTTFQGKGDTAQDPIPLKGLSKQDLIRGKYYVGTDGQVEQYNG